MFADRIETLILKSLLYHESYVRKVMPFLRQEYFRDASEKHLFNKIKDFVATYNSTPTKESLLVQLGNDSINDDTYKGVTKLVLEFENDDKLNLDWLYKETETFCQDMALTNAIIQSAAIIQGKDKALSKGSVPTLLSDALAISFDPRIGHDYLEDAESRYIQLRKKTERVPFDLDYMNRITCGGLPNKTINCILAGTNVGKSMFMAHMAAANLVDARNVLYITLELAKEWVAERVDANLMDISLSELKSMPLDMFKSRIEHIKRHTIGKLIIEEYPTAAANVNHFKKLLDDLKLKRNFTPDIIYIDYINLCASSRLSKNQDSYGYIKSISEELRGLAVEYNVPIMTATQLTRSGFGNSDPGMDDTSESFGLPMTMDFMFALTTSEELEQMGRVAVKQLKNRYSDVTRTKRFLLGVDRSKMKFYNIDDDQQTLLDANPSKEEKDVPQFDKGTFGKGMKAERRNKFSGIKV